MDPIIDMKKQYIKMFQEMDFRAFRAMIMNYIESHRYDCWASWADLIAVCTLISLAVLSPIQITMKFTSYSTFGIGLSFAVGTSSLLELYSRGPFWSSSLVNRAQMHVNAGAEWHKIHKMAKLYCFELEVTPQEDIQWDQQRERYNSLVDAYMHASKITVIREKAYDEHNKTDLIFKRMAEREEQFEAFQEREKSKKNNKSKSIEVQEESSEL